jgi:hypothetical protein
MMDVPKTICRNPECGHPRAEHRSRFLPDVTDYEYQECSFFECPCEAYVGDTFFEITATSSETVEETQPSCSVCGSDMLGHTCLGAECLAICESNWKKLRALERQMSEAKSSAAIPDQQTAQEGIREV